MWPRPLDLVLRQVRKLSGVPAPGAPTDRQLLECFVAGRDQAAFEALVRRHGPMVLGVGRRVLHNAADVEDAFQATFLVLARRAAAVPWRDSVGGWLHGVAYHAALKIRAGAARERACIKRRATMTRAEAPSEPEGRELRQVLDEELRRLPEKDRVPLVLCYLEGNTHEEAAALLGWPVGTVKGRLARGREALRRRLVRRGLTLAGGAFALALAETTAPAAVPAGLLAAAGRTFAAGAVSARVAGLAEAVRRALAASRLKAAVALALALAVLAGAAGLIAQQVRGAKPPATDVSRPGPKPQSPAREDWNGDPLPPGALARLGTVRLRHGGIHVGALAFCRDGNTLASGSWNDSVALWEVTTGKLLRRLEKAEADAVAFSPDGKALAAPARDGSVRLWEVASGKELRRFGHKNWGAVSSLAFSPDGKTLAAAGLARADGTAPNALGRLIQAEQLPGGFDGYFTTVRFWRVDTGKEVPRLTRKFATVQAVAISPDGKTLATAPADHNHVPPPVLRLWEVATGKELARCKGHQSYISALVFSPDGRAVASAGSRNIRLWEAAGGKEKRCWPHSHGGEATRLSDVTLCFTPDGQRVASAGTDGSVRLWKVMTGKEVRRFQGSSGLWPAGLAISPDGQTLAAGGGGNTVHLWKCATGKELLSRLAGHQGAVGAVAFAPGGKTLASAGGDNTLRLWETATGRPLRRLGKVEGFVSQLSFSPGGKSLVAVVAADDPLRVWDVAAGKERRRLGGTLLGSPNGTPVLSPDGKTLAVGGEKTVQLWDVAAGKERRRISLGEEITLVQPEVFSPDGRMLALVVWKPGDGKGGPSAPRVRLLDLASAQGSRRLSGAPRPATSPRFGPDGKTLLTVDTRHTYLWEVPTGRLRLRLGLQGQLTAFAPDGKVAASVVQQDHAVRLWEVATGKELRRFRGHQGDITFLAFSPDGKVLVSGSRDTTALLWDVSGLIWRKFPRPANLSPKELESLWAALADADAARAYRAVVKLGAAPGQSVAFLRDRTAGMRKAFRVDANRVARLVAHLDHEQFKVREAAEKELAGLGKVVEPALRKALGETRSSQVGSRLRVLLKQLQGLPPGAIRALRAVEVLESAGGPEAGRVLRALSRGAPAPLGGEAKAALERLAKRPAASP
jgi:RNA polymerase sigma factor (sigma-70 family)